MILSFEQQSGKKQFVLFKIFAFIVLIILFINIKPNNTALAVSFSAGEYLASTLPSDDIIQFDGDATIIMDSGLENTGFKCKYIDAGIYDLTIKSQDANTRKLLIKSDYSLIKAGNLNIDNVDISATMEKNSGVYMGFAIANSISINACSLIMNVSYGALNAKNGGISIQNSNININAGSACISAYTNISLYDCKLNLSGGRGINGETAILKNCNGTINANGTEGVFSNYNMLIDECDLVINGTLALASNNGIIQLSDNVYVKKPEGAIFDSYQDEIVNYNNTLYNSNGFTVRKAEITKKYITDEKCSVDNPPNKKYTGSAIEPNINIKWDNTILKNNTDYTLNYTNNKNAGTANITITGKGNYYGSIEKTFLIKKTTNTMSVKGKTVAIKYSKQKKKNQTISKKKAFSISKAKGTITFKKTSGNKKILISKAGKITVKRGLKKGKTYSIKVKVTAAGTKNYKKLSKAVTVKIKIK